jgi:cyclase
VQKIACETSLEVQVGGGIRTLKDMQIALDAGASKVLIGTILFSNPEIIRCAINLFGTQRLIVSLDVRGKDVRTNGWLKTSGVDLLDACRLVNSLGIQEILVTDIIKDGMGRGSNVGLYTDIKCSFPSLRLIASGGVGSTADIEALQRAFCDAAVVGKAVLENVDLLPQLLAVAGIQECQTFIDSPSSTLAIRVIACLDIADGRVVKGTRFGDLRDAGDPAELAKRYCDEGADELVFLDITATNENRKSVYDLASRVADTVNIPFTIGGGIRSVEDARRMLEAGADKVAVNSAGVKNPALFSQIASELGRANTVCAIDAKKKGSGWIVLVNGGRVATEIDAVEWAKKVTDLGAGELLVTSYDRDGTGDGFDTALLSAIKNVVPTPVIASGGAGTLASFSDAVRLGRADAVLAASVFHFGTLSIRDVKLALASSSFPIRL